MNSPVEDSLKQLLNDKLKALEDFLDADVLVYSGDLGPLPPNVFTKIVEELKNDVIKHDKLFVILTTNGGSGNSEGK